MGRPKKEAPNRSDGLYEVKVTVGKDFNGKPVRKSFYSSVSKADARAKAEQYKIEQALQDATGDIYLQAPSFKRIASDFLELKKGTIKNSTFNFTYQIPAEQYLIPYFGSVPISNIRKNDVELYLRKTQEKNGLSAETIRKHYICLNQIFKNAYENGYINRNPCTGIKIKCSQRSQKRTYTPEETALVLEYCPYHRYGLEVHLMLSYGISRSELLGIRWADVDLNEKIITIAQGVVEAKNPDTGRTEILVGTPKNEFRQRTFPISSATVNLLWQQLACKPDADYVISNHKGKVCSPSTWHERHYKVFMADMSAYYSAYDIQLPTLNPHELRHTRTTLWVNEDINLYAIASIMGWADLKMLRKRYAHPDVDSLRNIIK